MDEETVRRTEAFLREKLDGGAYFATRPKEKAYRLEHSYRVANLGAEIARSEGFDETAAVVACLLHDVSYCETFGEDGWREHGRRAAQIARPFLNGLGFPAALVNEICYGIAIHVDDASDFPGERTPLALTVGDADNLDRFDAYRVHEWLSRDAFLEMERAEGLAYAEQKLARLRELEEMPMGTETARRLWRERIAFCITFFEKLASQLRRGAEILPDRES